MGAKPPQVFDWGAWRWDVDAAIAIVAAHPREPRSIPVAPWMTMIGAMDVDPDHAAAVDLAVPLIVAPFLGSFMVIDGWHRLWRADRDGVERLPASVLSEAEEQQVRLRTGGTGESRRRTRR